MQLGTASNNDDLLGLLLESNQNQCEEKKNAERFMMTTEDVIEECRLFYFAGQEMTSVLLTWTMVVLSMHQDWEARAREEFLQVFGGWKLEFEGLNQLKVVTVILHEVLRLYPFPYNCSEANEIGRIQNPPWFAEGVSKASKDPAAYLPFSSGPRICIGQNFAMVEAKFCLHTRMPPTNSLLFSPDVGFRLSCTSCDFIVTNPVMSRA
ncbi:unnamed protein product [Spirodela intermedia]|uniref:Uncharacterized protein n=1 Tax=Spirodela intermedia TaxID=51605 RepID=A0A7I8LEK9_SPIIN|nr:unnamed protein product [Spirodela intermedia]